MTSAKPKLQLKQPSQHMPRRPRTALLVALLLLALVAMFMVRKCSHRQDAPFGAAYPAASQGDTIDVAIQISPLSYSLAGDSVSGLDYEMLTQMAAQHGRPVRFHPFAPLKYALEGLQNGSFDVVVAHLPSTAHLKRQWAVTHSVYLDREVLVQRKDAKERITAPEQLAGDTVSLSMGSPFAERMRNLASELGDTIIIRQHPDYTPEHLMMLVDAGTIRHAVVNEGAAVRMAEKFPALDATTPVSFTQFQIWALRPTDKGLRDTLNTWIDAYRATPAYRALTQRYLGR